MNMIRKLIRRLGLFLARPMDRRRVRVPTRVNEHVAGNLHRYLPSAQIKVIRGASRK